MVIVDQFLRLYEAEHISSIWKVSQILLYVICGLSSVVAAYSFGRLNFYFLHDNCLLYSNVTFVREIITKSHPNLNEGSENPNSSRAQVLHIGSVNNMMTEWGNPRACSYCIYVPTCSFIFCFVWATFFTMCGRGGRSVRGLPSPWRIVYPALGFNTVYFVTSLVASAWLHSGLKTFCNNFQRNMDEISCSALYRYSTPPSSAAYTYLCISEIFSWVNTLIWLLHIICLILRCVWVADFDLYKIQIITATTQPTSTGKIKVTFEDQDVLSLSPSKKSPSSKRKEKSNAVNVIENPGSNYVLKEKESSLLRLNKGESDFRRKPGTFERNKNPLILVEDYSEGSPGTSRSNSIDENAPSLLEHLTKDDQQKKEHTAPLANTNETTEIDLDSPAISLDTTEEARDKEVVNQVPKTEEVYNAEKRKIHLSPLVETTTNNDSEIVNVYEHEGDPSLSSISHLNNVPSGMIQLYLSSDNTATKSEITLHNPDEVNIKESEGTSVGAENKTNLHSSLNADKNSVLSMIKESDNEENLPHSLSTRDQGTDISTGLLDLYDLVDSESSPLLIDEVVGTSQAIQLEENTETKAQKKGEKKKTDDQNK